MMLYFSVTSQSNDFSGNNSENNMDTNRNDHNDNSDNNSIGYGSSISNDDDIVFDALGPFEKLCKQCDNPTPSNIE